MSHQAPPPTAPEANSRAMQVVCTALALALLAALLALSVWLWRGQQRPMLLAPALGNMADCLALADADADLEPACSSPQQGSAAARIEDALAELGPRRSLNGHFEMGYTLVLPLLNLYEQKADGQTWALNQQAIHRVARTVRDVQRPVVLYLFSTHFSEGAPIEPVLAQDPDNMAHTPAGPLGVDSFLGAPLYPWSIARTDNPITRLREDAIRAVADALCQQPEAVRQRIAGINLLGEVHHMYPNFEAGMGRDSPYVLTDYSPHSRQGFRHFLQQRFGSVQALNAHLGAHFARFDDIDPPAKDIRHEPLQHYWQHLDSAAAGDLSIGGWVHDAALPAGATPWVRVYLNGEQIARVPAHFVRQDVLQALPQLGTAKVGWAHTLHYAGLPPGRYRLDIAFERSPTQLLHLGTRHIAVMDRQQTPPVDAPMRRPLPAMQPADDALRHWVDTPQNDASLYFNPLAVLWHEYRNQQVVDYLRHFERVLDHTCLSPIPLRTQQIYPAEKAGWDPSRFASEQSLRPFGRVRLGINLYGEASYDDSFFNWLARSRQNGYSVTEFHPLRAMNAQELRNVLEKHRRHGVQTFSFFLHVRHGARPGQPAPLHHNPYVLHPGNPTHGSDTLFQAVREVMTQ